MEAFISLVFLVKEQQHLFLTCCHHGAKQLEVNQSLFYFWLRISCEVSCGTASCGWIRGRVSWAGALAAGLIDRMEEEAVGARQAAILDTESEVCGGNGLPNPIHVHAKDVGV